MKFKRQLAESLEPATTEGTPIIVAYTLPLEEKIPKTWIQGEVGNTPHWGWWGPKLARALPASQTVQKT